MTEEDVLSMLRSLVVTGAFIVVVVGTLILMVLQYLLRILVLWFSRYFPGLEFLQKEE
ncbi:MAG: hypothetical protein AAB407_02860 [Patescibacteria group bacterium]